jgi:SOS-response transcriptional repressor LexA
MNGPIRPTKKQREILTFIEKFIAEHGYSPSYREIMAGLNYTSVATVALHVNSLIKRGHIRKRDRSARSLEVVRQPASAGPKVAEVTPAQEKWLIDLIEQRFAEAESVPEPDPKRVDELYVLVGALKILGLEGAAVSFIPRLTALRKPAGQA